MLWNFAGRIDRQLLGSRFNKSHNDQYRTAYVAYAEGFPDVGHLHCFMRVVPYNASRFRSLCDEGRFRLEWERVVVGGTLCLEEIGDHAGWLRYSTKELVLGNEGDRWMVI